MKKSILTLLLIATNAFAGVQDITFLPKQGEIVGLTGIGSSRSEVSGSYSGSKLSLTNEISAFRQLIGTGITDTFTIGLQAYLVSSGETRLKYANIILARGDYDTGIQNFKFAAIKRIILESGGAFKYLQVEGDFCPKDGDKKLRSDYISGRITLGVQPDELNKVVVSGEFTNFNSNDSVGSNSTNTLAILYQHDFINSIFVRGTATLNQSTDIKYSGGDVLSSDPGYGYGLSLGGGFSNKVDLVATYSYADENVNYKTGTTNIKGTANSSVFELTVGYIF